MPNPKDEKANNFDDALQHYLSKESATAETPVESAIDTVPAETPAETAPVTPEQTSPAETPAAPAEQPAAAAAPEAIAIEAANRAAAQLAAMLQENATLKAQIAEQSQAAEAKIEDTLTPPILDLSNLSYMSDTERAAQSADYANKMADFVKKTIDPSLKPVVDAFAKQKQAAEEQTVIAEFKQSTPDIEKYLPEIQEFMLKGGDIAAAMSKLPARQRIATLYMIAKGGESLNPVQKTPEQIAEEVYANPDVMRNLELKKTNELKKNQQVPAQAASSGMANIPVTTTKKPTSWDEADKRAAKMMGLN